MDFSGNIEKVMLECEVKGINLGEVLQLIEVPNEWTGNSYLFDFNTMPVEELSDYIDYIFRKRLYFLKEGTPINGFYAKENYHSVPYNTETDVYYRYKVEIYSNEGKTYLEIYMPYEKTYEEFSRFEKILAGEKHTKKLLELKYAELDIIVGQIKFLKPSIKGYLICNKCGAYYEVHNEESPEGYPDECDCGGIFKYIASPKQPDKKLAKRKKTANPLKYLRAPAAMIIVSFFCYLWGYYSSILNYMAIGFGYGIIFAIVRYNGFELLLDTIYLRLIYFSAAIIFFIGSFGIITIIIQINNYNTTMIEFIIVAIISLIYGIGMIFRAIDPDNPRNFLDPPLYDNL